MKKPKRSFLKNEETSFRDRIFVVVRKIPRGNTLTYKEVATRAGKAKAVRAVGNIVSSNYNPDIPCHRVIRSDGQTGGYNRGAQNKIAILKKESFHFHEKN